MTWVLIAFILSSGLFDGTVLETGMDFERCMAKATSHRLANTGSDTQFVCWPEIKERRYG